MANKRKNRVGVILCGGKGTRLYPLTKFQNKHTLPIGLTPMLFYPLKTLRKFGVYRVLVIIDRDGADETIGMLGSGKEFGMDISYKVQEGAGGISEALYLAKDFVKRDQEIVCILGDNIFDNESLDADFTLEPENLACVFVKEVSNPQDYGVAVVEDGRITKIVEKPKEFVSNLGVVGLYVFTDDVFEVIESTKPSERGELEISSVNDFFASSGVLQHQVVKGYWGDAGGSIQRYAECSMHGAKQANVSAEEIDSFRSIVFDDK
jgi:glucose-1-phosphate thymidylyltransferase